LFGTAGAEFQLPEGRFEGFCFGEDARFVLGAAASVDRSSLTEKLPERKTKATASALAGKKLLKLGFGAATRAGLGGFGASLAASG